MQLYWTVDFIAANDIEDLLRLSQTNSHRQLKGQGIRPVLAARQQAEIDARQ